MPREAFRLAHKAQMLADDSTGEVMLYGEITENMPKFWKDQMPDDKCAVDFDKDIKELKKSGAKRLLLRINSPGGVVTEAVAMRSILTGAGFDEINIRIEGMCASAATLIASIPGANCEIAPGSVYMIHNPWTWAVGNAAELEKVIGQLRQIEDTSRKFYAAKSGQDEEQIRQWMDDETWFTADEALKYGFVDAVTKEEQEAPAVACVTGHQMRVMRELYRTIPDRVTVEERTEDPKAELERLTDAAKAALKPISNADPVAGKAPEINHEEGTQMDIKDLNIDQLRAENPGLLESIRQDAMTAERTRCQDIDDLTPPYAEYQTMAEEAKKNGTTAMDFQKQVVAAMKQKGNDFLQSRVAETAPAKDVVGGAPESAKDDEKELEDYAKELAEMAKEMSARTSGTMF